MSAEAATNAPQRRRPTSWGRVAFFAVAFVVSSVYLYGAVDLGVGSLSIPGAGFFPVAVGGLGLIASLAALTQELLRRPAEGETSDEPKMDERRAFLLLAYMAVYPLTVETLGHIISGAILCTGIIMIPRQRPFYQAAVIAVVMSAGSYWLFHALDIRLPAGVLF